MGQTWNDRTERWEDTFERRPYRTGWKWFFGILGTLLLVGIVMTVVGFLNNWGQTAVKVVSPQNVEKQYNYVIRDYEALYATAENACSAISETDESSPTFVEGPAQAYAGAFRRVVLDYNKRMNDIFEAKLVGPPGYPREIPRNLGSNGDWCSVPDQLDALSNG